MNNGNNLQKVMGDDSTGHCPGHESQGRNTNSGCCDNKDGENSMARCMAKCRHVPWFPVVLGTIFLLLGYFLNPEVLRVLWITGAVLVAATGVIGLIAIHRMAASGNSACCRN